MEGTTGKPIPWRLILLLGILGVLLGGMVVLRPFDRWRMAAAFHPAVGKPLPEIRLEPLTSATRREVTSELRGQVLLLNFWGTWCPPCRLEFPHIAALEKKYRGRNDFKLLAVSCFSGDEDADELRQATEEFLAEAQADLPTFQDTGGSARFKLHQIGAFNGYPTTLAVDRQGNLRAIWDGYAPGAEHEIERLVAQLLTEK